MGIVVFRNASWGIPFLPKQREVRGLPPSSTPPLNNRTTALSRMTRGKATDPALCWVVIRMLALKVPPSSISIQTGVAERTVRQIGRRFAKTGDPTLPKREKASAHSRCALSASDMKVFMCFSGLWNIPPKLTYNVPVSRSKYREATGRLPFRACK